MLTIPVGPLLYNISTRLCSDFKLVASCILRSLCMSDWCPRLFFFSKYDATVWRHRFRIMTVSLIVGLYFTYSSGPKVDNFFGLCSPKSHSSMAPLSEPHQGRARALLGGLVLLTTLPPVFVLLRVWARRLKRTPLCFNDYTIIAAMVLVQAQAVVDLLILRYFKVFACGFDVNAIISTLNKAH